MELNNDFEVSVPVDRAWTVLTDLERIAPCLPGAQLQEVDGDEYRGVVKVKVGPITAQYKGTATFAERDEAARRVVLDASGRDARGAGNASAVITAQLEPAGTRTRVSLVTDLTVTGKVATFGRSALEDVSAKLLGQFVDNLEATVLAAESADAGSTSEPAAPAVDDTALRSVPADTEVAPIDLLDAAGAPIGKRLLPLLGVVVVVVVVVGLLRRRRRVR